MRNTTISKQGKQMLAVAMLPGYPYEDPQAPEIVVIAISKICA